PSALPAVLGLPYSGQPVLLERATASTPDSFLPTSRFIAFFGLGLQCCRPCCGPASTTSTASGGAVAYCWLFLGVLFSRSSAFRGCCWYHLDTAGGFEPFVACSADYFLQRFCWGRRFLSRASSAH